MANIIICLLPRWIRFISLLTFFITMINNNVGCFNKTRIKTNIIWSRSLQVLKLSSSPPSHVSSCSGADLIIATFSGTMKLVVLLNLMVAYASKLDNCVPHYQLYDNVKSCWLTQLLSAKSKSSWVNQQVKSCFKKSFFGAQLLDA